MTLNEVQEIILKNSYIAGFRYIARNENKKLCAYEKEPVKYGGYWRKEPASEKEEILFMDEFFPNINWEDEQPFEIPQYIDWHAVPVDTKVLASDNGKDWIRGHFYKYSEGGEYPFAIFAGGTTSWSTDMDTLGYKYCKLAEE